MRNAVRENVALVVIATANFLGPRFPFPARFSESRAHHSNIVDTLFHPGIVKWQGRLDVPGAVAAWKKLLKPNPS